MYFERGERKKEDDGREERSPAVRNNAAGVRSIKPVVVGRSPKGVNSRIFFVSSPRRRRERMRVEDEDEDEAREREVRDTETRRFTAHYRGSDCCAKSLRRRPFARVLLVAARVRHLLRVAI